MTTDPRDKWIGCHFDKESLKKAPEHEQIKQPTSSRLGRCIYNSMRMQNNHHNQIQMIVIRASSSLSSLNSQISRSPAVTLKEIVAKGC